MLMMFVTLVTLTTAALPEDPRTRFERGIKLLESRRADDAQAALGELQQALEGFRTSEEQASEYAETLYAMALALELTGDRPAALEFDRRAVEIFEKLGDLHGLAAAHDHWASILISQSELDPARLHFQTALEARRRLDDRPAIATSLHNLASLELEAGRGGAALDLFHQSLDFQQSLDLQDGLGDPSFQAATLNNLGLLWLHLGRADSGRKFLQSALEQHRRADDRLSQAGTLNNLAWTAWQERRWPEARQWLDEALHIYRTFGHHAGIAETLGNLGLVDLEEGDLDSSRRRIEGAIEAARRRGLSRIEASHLGSLGRWWLVSGDLDRAISTLGEAADRQQSIGDPTGLTITLFDLAKAHSRAGDLEAARSAIDHSIATVEALGSRIGVGDMRAYFLAPHRHIYDFRIGLLIQQGLWEQALITSEQAKARGLLDWLTWDAPASPPQEPSEPPTLEEIRALIGDDTAALVFHLGADRAWAWVITSARLSGFDLGSSADLERPATKARDALARSQPRVARGLAQRSLDHLAQALTAPLTSMTHRRWLIVPDGALHGTPFAALPLADRRPVVSHHEVVTLPSLTVLARLRARGVERAKTAAKDSQRGELAVLADPVFDVHDPRLSPTKLQPSNSQPSKSQPTRSADGSVGPQNLDFDPVWRPSELNLPRLPFSAAEAERIAKFFPPDRVRIQTGFDATAASVIGGELNHFRRLHFATHAIVDDRHPERSGLALSAVDSRGRPLKAGFLRLAELFKLRLDADLVTLSACRSALGKPLRGEGLLGLSRGFFAAGARRLVAGLWDVDDRAAVELMAAFYEHSARDGLDSAAALAAAQRRLRDDPRWSAPFYWAGFVLLGDWQ